MQLLQKQKEKAKNWIKNIRKVEKPWGYEFHLLATDRLALKVLLIIQGHQLSLQYHKQKDESISCVWGKAELTIATPTFSQIMTLVPYQSYEIKHNTIHRIKAIEDTALLEVSTPELDDVVRLADDYKRETKFKLGKCDVILFTQEGNDIWSVIGRWAIGLYGHVGLYLGRFFGVPMFYQSAGRGAAINSLIPETGRHVLVMRPNIQPAKADEVVNQAFKIASSPQSYYDYFCIVKNCVPRVLKEKFPFLPIPLKYHRDAALICSEAVAEAFWQADIPVLSKEVVPLPCDFLKSSILERVFDGRILENIDGE